MQHGAIEQDIRVMKPKNKVVAMGKFDKRFDVRKMNSLHSNMWRKGLIH